MMSIEMMPWLLVGAPNLWAADCLVPGCLWTITTSTPEAADDAAARHHLHVHPERAAADVQEVR